MLVEEAIKTGATGARGRGHAGTSKPAVRILVLAPAPGTAGLGGANNAWIIEDDYDGEYRYVSRPLPALKSLDRDGRVLYAGTFSKVLFPGVRLAYLVVPEAQVERFEQISQIFVGGCPELTQSIVTAFIRKAISRAISSACADFTPSAGTPRRRAWRACWAGTCESTRSPEACI